MSPGEQKVEKNAQREHVGRDSDGLIFELLWRSELGRQGRSADGECSALIRTVVSLNKFSDAEIEQFDFAVLANPTVGVRELLGLKFLNAC